MAKNDDGRACHSAGGFRRTVAAVRFSALGDIAMTLPVVYEACRENPDTLFVMVTRAHPARMFVNAPANLAVEGVDLDRYRGVAGMRRLVGMLREKYGVFTMVDLHDVIRTRLMRLFARLGGMTTSVIRKGRQEKKSLTRGRRKILVPLKPMHERYREAFQKGGVAVEGDLRSLFADGRPDPSVFESATLPRQAGEKWIAIAPFARHAGKIYPLPLMEKVVKALSGEGRKLFIFGFGEKEEAIIAQWRARCPGVVNMAAEALGLEAELALLSYCDIMVSMDSANMHLASLAGIRVVSIWGATHPYCGFMGMRQRMGDAVQLDMTCRPCSVFGNRPCARGDLQCLNGIPPQLIIDKVENLLIHS